jgi:hypothetical protein
MRRAALAFTYSDSFAFAFKFFVLFAAFAIA